MLDEIIKIFATNIGYCSASNPDYPVWRHYVTVHELLLPISCCSHLTVILTVFYDGYTADCVSEQKIEMRDVWEQVEQKGAIKSRRF
jgi:hypothetical protein